MAIGDLLKEGHNSMLKGKYKMVVKLFEKAFGLEYLGGVVDTNKQTANERGYQRQGNTPY